MNALIGGCLVPDLDREPLHSTSTNFTSTFVASANRDAEIVQPEMPFSRRCQSDVDLPEESLRLNLV